MENQDFKSRAEQKKAIGNDTARDNEPSKDNITPKKSKSKAELLSREKAKIKKLKTLIKQGKEKRERAEQEVRDLTRAITSQQLELSMSRNVASILNYQAKEERRLLFKQQSEVLK